MCLYFFHYSQHGNSWMLSDIDVDVWSIILTPKWMSLHAVINIPSTWCRKWQCFWLSSLLGFLPVSDPGHQARCWTGCGGGPPPRRSCPLWGRGGDGRGGEGAAWPGPPDPAHCHTGSISRLSEQNLPILDFRGRCRYREFKKTYPYINHIDWLYKILCFILGVEQHLGI